MDHVYEANVSATPPSAPASPAVGYPRSGNPSTATGATKQGPYWYYMITESLRQLIVDAGLTPDHTNLNLVSQAVQAMISGGVANDYKISVRFTTTGNIVLSGLGTQAGGDWGAALTAGDRILPKDQTTGSQSGIYIASAGAWARATDADGVGELTSGAIVAVEEGVTLADTQWMLTTDGAITIGTTPLTFAQKGASPFASAAEARAFSVANKSISPETLAEAFKGSNQSIAAAGYQKLPGGVILQWATLTTDASGFATITYPIAFPTAALVVIPGGSDTNYYAIRETNRTSTTRTYHLTVSSTGANAPAGISFGVLALGT